jgi:hypothetical protein
VTVDRSAARRAAVPSDADAEQLSDLVDDARAIPAAAFARPARLERKVIDLSTLPRQRSTVQIPATTASLVEAAEHEIAGYRR